MSKTRLEIRFLNILRHPFIFLSLKIFENFQIFFDFVILFNCQTYQAVSFGLIKGLATEKISESIIKDTRPIINVEMFENSTN